MNKDKIAIISKDGVKHTYYDLVEDGKAMISFIKKRCVVVFLCTNSYECVMGYVACIKNRIVPMMLSDEVSSELLENIVDKYKPSYIWMKKNRIIEQYAYKFIFEFKDYVLIELYDSQINLEDNIALLLSTSGTTGNSKFVRISYENILENTKSIVSSLNIRSDDRAVNILPLNYTYGLSVINSHLLVGATILLAQNHIYERDFWDFFEKFKGTTFSAVPYTYETIIKLRLIEKFPASLRLLTQAGGKLDVHFQEMIAKYAIGRKIEFYVMYGQTEATARITCMRLDNDLKHIGSVGKFINGVTGEVTVDGELVIYGKSVSMGYAESFSDLSKANLNNGMLYTGDYVTVDEDGYIYWKGRKDRSIKVLGSKVNLDELDEILRNRFEGYIFVCNSVISNRIIINTNCDEKQEILKYASRITSFNEKVFTYNYVATFSFKENGKININEIINNNISGL